MPTIQVADKPTLDLTKTAALAAQAGAESADTKLGLTTDSGGSSSAGTISAKINKLIAELTATSIIRGIQRGVATMSTDSITVNLPTSLTDTSKALVLINGGEVPSSNWSGAITYLFELTATSLTFKGKGNSSGSSYEFSWQVIEFY